MKPTTRSLLTAAVLISVTVAQSKCPSGYIKVSTSTITSTTSTTTSSTSTSTPSSNAIIQWQKCPTKQESNLQCGLLAVPIDWTDSSLGLMQLPVVRVPATETPRNESIITNGGGPGVSGIEDLVSGYGSVLQSLIGQDWDIVSFDPRGVGLTMEYQCPDSVPDDDDDDDEDDDDDQGDFDTPDYYPPSHLIPDTDEWFQNSFNAYTAQAQLCASAAYKQAGQLIGTAFVARDINAIAEALGQDGLIRYHGGSYGTLLGATVAAMFPSRVDRVLLDGNINPTDYYRGLGDEAVASYDNATEFFFNACAQAGGKYCPLAESGKTGAQLLAQYWDFYNKLRNGSIETFDANNKSIKYGDVLDSMQAVAFAGKNAWPREVRKLAIYYNNQRNASSLTRRQALFDPTQAKSALDTGTALLVGVTCGDSIRYGATGGDTFRHYQDVYRKTSTYGYESIISIILACSTWTVDAKEKFQGAFAGIKTRTPVLFVQGFYDPVTPLASAVNSSSGFVGSQILLHYGTGHCAGRDPSDEVDKKIASYFNTGILPDTSEIASPNTPAYPNLLLNGPTKRSVEPIDHELRAAQSKRLEHLLNRQRRSVDEYPDLLRNAKPDVYEILRKREIEGMNAYKSQVVPPYCVPITPSSNSIAPTSGVWTTAQPPTSPTSSAGDHNHGERPAPTRKPSRVCKRRQH